MTSSRDLPEVSRVVAQSAEKKARFQLVEVAPFDARRGYRRCSPPGVGASFVGRPGAVADFWRDRSGEVVMRFSSQGYDYHCRARLKSGGPVREDQMEDFADWVADVLFEWIIEGVDDGPPVT